MDKKTIVILGAGFGGLRAAKLLGKRIKKQKKGDFELILIDQNDHHTYTPLLYEAATTSKETLNISGLHELVAFPIKSLIEGLPVEFIQAKVKDVDPVSGLIVLDKKYIKADGIIIALGSTTNYYDIPGLKENSLPLRSFYDSIKIRERLLSIIGDKHDIRIVIGGGGSTGVELSGEMKSWIEDLKGTFPASSFQVSLMEASPSILPGFEKKLSIYARKRLNNLGVRIFEGESIKSVSEEVITTSSGRFMPFDLLIWAGGITSPDIINKIELKKDARGRLLVSPDMKCKDENAKTKTPIYAIGDNASIFEKNKSISVPATARAAMRQAETASRNLWAEMNRKKSKLIKFRGISNAYVVPVGGKATIARLGPFIFKNRLAWTFKNLIELRYLASIMNAKEAFKIWLRILKVFSKNDRLG